MTNFLFQALAASASGDGIAYVYLKPVNCRTIFSPPSQSPKDSMWNDYLPSQHNLPLTCHIEDPAQNNQATNGEIWYYSELPMLMRNLNIKQIKSFHKNGRRFEEKVEWDAEKVSHNISRSLAHTGPCSGDSFSIFRIKEPCLVTSTRTFPWMQLQLFYLLLLDGHR